MEVHLVCLLLVASAFFLFNPAEILAFVCGFGCFLMVNFFFVRKLLQPMSISRISDSFHALDRSVNPDLLNRYKQIPLMLAAMHGNISCVKKLIEAGANILMFNSLNGRTCLHYAGYYGHSDSLQTILSTARTSHVAVSCKLCKPYSCPSLTDVAAHYETLEFSTVNFRNCSFGSFILEFSTPSGHSSCSNKSPKLSMSNYQGLNRKRINWTSILMLIQTHLL